MTTLTIYHNIYLTKEQRYALHEETDLKVEGVATPVWLSKNKTSEPAQEVFCYYYLKNQKVNYPIQILEDGFEIILPHRPGKKVPLLEDEWRILNEKKQIERYYSQWQNRTTSENLLDLKDGGSECIIYREHNKIKENDEMMNVLHFVNIGKIETLTESLN